MKMHSVRNMQKLNTMIVLKPKHIKRYKEIILSNLHQKFDNTYSKEYDCFVTNVTNIENITNIISRTGDNIIFNVTFNANKIELKVKSKIEARVINIVPKEGVYLEQGIIKIILPFHRINKKFLKGDEFRIKNKLVQLGDMIKVTIYDFVYNKTEISCIAKYKE